MIHLKIIPIKNHPNVFFHRFKTIFSEKTKSFEQKEISIPLISILTLVLAYILYIYIHSISITTPM